MLKMTIRAIQSATHDHSMCTQKEYEVFDDFVKNDHFFEISFVGLCILGAHTVGARLTAKTPLPNVQHIFVRASNS